MRRSLLFVVLASACTESDLAIEAVVHAEDPFGELAERTRVASLGEARLTEHGPAIADDWRGGSGWGEHAVVEVGARVRIVYDGPDARLLLWLDPEDLGRWVIDDSFGGARPGADEQTGVWLPGGTDVEAVDTDGDWTLVTTATRELLISAWVPAFDVGPYWIDRPAEARTWAHHDVFLRGSAPLLDRPYGDVFATVTPFLDDAEPGADVAYVGAELVEWREEHALVEVRSGGITARAWIPEDQVSERVEGGTGSSCCGGCAGMGWGWGIFPGHWLPAGTPLYDGPDGALIGETVKDRNWPPGETTEDGWSSIRVPTPWGAATLWTW